MLRQLTAIIFTLCLTLAPGLRWSTAWEGSTEKSEHFAIFYQRQDLQTVLNLLPIAEKEYHRVTGVIGHQPEIPLHVYVARDASEFHFLTQGRIPEWGIGAAMPQEGRIVLISPRQSPDGADIHQVLAHELSHVILGQALGESRAPRWLDEGLAQFVSHEWKLGQSVLVARALLFDSVIPLEEIETLNSFQRSKAQLAYAESFLAVAFIRDRFGESGLHELVRNLARYDDLDLAMQTSLRMTLSEFYLSWRDYVISRFDWASILSHPFVLWMLMFSLFVLVFILKRRRSRKIMERWRLEEAGLGEHHSLGDSGDRWSQP